MNNDMGALKKNILLGALAFAALVTFPQSCRSELDEAALSGDVIVFRASADYLNGPETRTLYSGYEYGGKERIDWVNGDLMRISSDKARHPGGDAFSDYKVTGVTAGTGGSQAISYASVKNVGANGLQWGSGTHNFYAVYPSPASNSSISISNNVADFTIPQNQLQAAQMDYAYMYAAVQTAAKATVNLAFKPMFTAFQFKVHSEEDASMTITSFSLSTGENKAMSGSCRATITAGSNTSASTAVFSNFTAYNSSSGNNTITVDMGSGVTVTPSTYATITVFALPQDYSQLTASFTTSSGETKSLKLQNADGTWVNFSACHKYNINGLGLPGEWTYTVSSIDDIIRTGEQVLYDYNKDVTVTLRRSRTGSATQNLPWKAYFTAASDPTAVVGASAVGQSWSETPLQDADGNDWLSLSAYSGNGDANSVKVSLAGNELPPSSIDLMVDAQAMTTAMSANNLGTIDLSRMKFNGSAFAYRRTNPANTANCYVINGYGTFYLPLVYGNGVQNGAAAQAYRGVSGENCLETFINADGQPITSDFILQDANLTKSGQYEARIVWQDVAPGFQIIRDSDVAFVPAGSSELSGVAALNCAYLKFQVRQYQSQVSGKGIKPGNAVIALYDKGEDKILWSWHIWFTNEVFFTANLFDDNSVNSMTLLSCDLGWCPPISYLSSSVLSRGQKMVIVDLNTSNVRIVVNITQGDYARGSFKQKYYLSCIYQFGRHHPFIGNAYAPVILRKYSSLHYSDLFTLVYGAYDGYISSQIGDNGFTIRNPHVFYYVRSNDDSIYNRYKNLLNADPSDAVSRKTIYDPCPAGFKVMPRPPYGEIGLGKEKGSEGDLPEGITLLNSSLVFYPHVGVGSNGVMSSLAWSLMTSTDNMYIYEGNHRVPDFTPHLLSNNGMVITTSSMFLVGTGMSVRPTLD